MISWLFPPSCPCDPAAKAWVERRLGWLANQFPDSAFTGRPVVLPTAEFFPEGFAGTRESVRPLLDRVCVYMDVEPRMVDLQFAPVAKEMWLVGGNGKDTSLAPAGTYEAGGRGSVIRINDSQLIEPIGLIGTLAHELAHVRLLGERRCRESEFDNELLTDLTVVHFGLGIFLANLPRHWDGDYRQWPGTKLRRPQYMSAPLYGWALAHLAWIRGEAKPEWARHLTWDAKDNFRQGLRYLTKTGDTSYRPNRSAAFD